MDIANGGTGLKDSIGVE